MGDGYSRASIGIEIVTIIAAVISSLHDGLSSPTSIFFITVAVAYFLGAILWGLNTPLVMTQSTITVEFDVEGSATITKEQTVVALRRNVSRFDEKIASEGSIVIDELTFDGRRTAPLIEQDTMISHRLRQVLRTEIPIFSRRTRLFRGQMIRSFCKEREWFEAEVVYPTRRFEVKLIFPKERAPSSVEVYRSRASADLSYPQLDVKRQDDGRLCAPLTLMYPKTGVVYRFEWEWGPVHNGANAGYGSVVHSARSANGGVATFTPTPTSPLPIVGIPPGTN